MIRAVSASYAPGAVTAPGWARSDCNLAAAVIELTPDSRQSQA
jgi:hypothetical protein